MLTVRQYVLRKYDKSSAYSLLAIEAKVFQVAYPLRANWLDHCGDRVITLDMAKSLLQRLKNSHASKGSANKHTERAIRILQAEIDGGSLPECDVLLKPKPVTVSASRHVSPSGWPITVGSEYHPYKCVCLLAPWDCECYGEHEAKQSGLLPQLSLL